ncbi:MAG: exodeoxyribonuclease VII large subunit, partial [Desulfuromonadales bacterium]|nr:exodeoxyribonuclease VII large subunit [Desulfuromonadales bacterium]
LVVKERLALENHLDHLVLRMATQVRSRLQRLGDRVDGLRIVLRSPIERISQSRQRRDDLERRLTRSARTTIDNARQVLGAQ